MAAPRQVAGLQLPHILQQETELETTHGPALHPLTGMLKQRAVLPVRKTMSIPTRKVTSIKMTTVTGKKITVKAGNLPSRNNRTPLPSQKPGHRITVLTARRWSDKAIRATEDLRVCITAAA
jgi:hypothetical protein